MSKLVQSAAKTIVPSRIPDFITKTRAIADEMETMYGSTPVEGQSLAAAMILDKYGCL